MKHLWTIHPVKEGVLQTVLSPNSRFCSILMFLPRKHFSLSLVLESEFCASNSCSEASKKKRPPVFRFFRSRFRQISVLFFLNAQNLSTATSLRVRYRFTSLLSAQIPHKKLRSDLVLDMRAPPRQRTAVQEYSVQLLTVSEGL